MWKKFVYLSLLAFFYACTTMNVIDHKAGVLSVINDINKSNTQALITCSKVPFLFDGEILLRKADVSILWNNLKEADFNIDDPLITAIEKVNQDTYKEFADTMEVKVFFNKYISTDCVLIRVKSTNGENLFIAAEKPECDLKIFAFKGV